MVTNIRWCEYCKQYNTDALYFFERDKRHLTIIREGDGSNLLEEDEEDGFVDYWYATVYDTNSEIGGGQMLLEEVIQEANKTLDEIIDYLNENCDIFDEVPELLKENLIDPERGKRLEKLFYNVDDAFYKYKIAKFDLSYFLEVKDN